MPEGQRSAGLFSYTAFKALAEAGRLSPALVGRRCRTYSGHGFATSSFEFEGSSRSPASEQIGN